MTHLTVMFTRFEDVEAMCRDWLLLISRSLSAAMPWIASIPDVA
jgi:hypothetical protein